MNSKILLLATIFSLGILISTVSCKGPSDNEKPATNEIVNSEKPEPPFTLANEAIIYMENGALDSAKEVMVKAVEMDSSYHEGYGTLAMIAYKADNQQDFKNYITAAIYACQQQLNKTSGDKLELQLNYLFYNHLLHGRQEFANRLDTLLKNADAEHLYTEQSVHFSSIQQLLDKESSVLINEVLPEKKENS